MVVTKKDGKLLNEIREVSSIHGTRYLVAQNKIRYQRVFWLLLMSIVSFLFGSLVYQITDRHFSEQVIIRNSKTQYNISEIFHPAMTYCLELNISGTNFSENEAFYDVLGYVNSERNFNFNMSSIVSEFEKRTQLEWFKKCAFGSFDFGAVMPISTILTKHGICFTFNMQPAKSMFNLDKVSTDFHYKKSFNMTHFSNISTINYEPPWRPVASGGSFIEFRLRTCELNCKACGYDYPREDNASILQYEESNPFQPADGILIIVHSPDEYPLNHGQSIYVSYWAFNYWIFHPEMFLIDDEIKAWPLEKRNCYLVDEKKLIFFKIYTKNNCEHECLSFWILKKCRCVPFFLIRSPSSVVCSNRDKTCVTEAETDFHVDKDDRRNSCRCLDRCEYVQFQVNARYASGYMTTRLLPSYVSRFFIPTVKRNAFGSSEFLGSIGGLMGLFAGMSIISFVEVGFSIIHPVIARLRNRKITHEITEVAPVNPIMIEKTISSRCSLFFATIMNKSDIHGLKHIVKKNETISARVFWTITVLVSTAFCFWQIFNIIKNSEMNPIEYAIDQNVWDISKVPFPQITFCPDVNRITYRKHRACFDSHECSGIDPEMVKILRDPIKGAQELKPLEFIFSLTKEKVFELGPEFLNKIRAFSRPERFVNQSYCCSGSLEVRFKETLIGGSTCFTMNYDEKLFYGSELGKDFTEPKLFIVGCKDRSALLKVKTMTIDVKNKFEDGECCRRVHGSFSIHNLKEFAADMSTPLLQNLNTRIILEPEITTTDESLRKYSPKIRNCYFSDEKKLKYFTTYSQSYCQTERESTLYQENCGCTAFDLPRNDSQRICNREDSKCQTNIRLAIRRKNMKDTGNDICLPDCNSIVYNYEVINEMMKPEDNITVPDIRYSASINFGSDEFVAYKRFESYGTVGLLSNIGGLLGLFLGLSVLSVIETIYFFTLRFLDDLWLGAQFRSQSVSSK